MRRSWEIYLLFAAFSALVIFSNQNDWDHFFSFFEVELRSWLVDHAPPLWTYQLCAGVTRLGDPQSFGLSPLFLPILLFGSFWGAKVLVIACAVLGYLYLTRIFSFLSPASADARVSSSLAAFFLFGNYFLWHIHVGHVTFALLFFSFVPAYYLLLGCRHRLKRKESVGLCLSAFCYCTAGFYHSAVFFVLPMIGIFFTLLLFLRPKPPSLRIIGPTAAALAAALVLSAYKWVGVLRYQDQFPRLLKDVFDEFNPPLQFLARFTLPTFRFHYLGFIPDQGPWSVYEYSAFSFLPWAFFALMAAAFLSREKIEWKASWARELAFCFCVTVLFCLGNLSPFLPVRWVNGFLLNDSLRVVARFQVVLIFLLAVFLVRFLALHAHARAFYLKWLRPAGFLLTLLSLLTFFPLLNWDGSQRELGEVRGEMNSLRPVRAREPELVSHSYMYAAVNANRIVPNCYQPLGRFVKIGHERWRSPVLPPPVNGEIDLLAPGASPLSPECRGSAYVTQNEVHFDAGACPKDLCFHLNMLNLHREFNLVWNEGRRLYCIQ